MNKCKSIFILFLFFFSNLFSQEKIIIYDSKTDLRQIAKTEFGDANLWPAILKLNNYNINEIPQIGAPLKIPSKKINDILKKFSTAEKSVKDAIDIGAKVLAEELISSAISKLNDAYKLKREYEFYKLDNICNEIITESKSAYVKTKEMREKTIDAILSYKVGTVQKLLPSAIKWNDINILENLKENDLARTLAKSLAKITFYDLNQIKLNENSQAIIQHSKFDFLTNKTESKVKVEKGNAYAMLYNSPKKKFDLEIQGVKTKINSKYFWVEKNNKVSKFSNYQGTIEISSNDSIVSIKRNQGTIVEESKPPLKPINLLSPPELIYPNNNELFSSSSIIFSWSKVDKAKNYWLEIAEDDSFKNIYSQIKNIDTTIIGVHNITDGIKYWRVCSVDDFGLPGIYSEPKAFAVKINSSLPQLIILHPYDNFNTKDSLLIIKGKTDENCKVKVNDLTAITKDNYFEVKLFLKPGYNKLNITSTNKSNKSNTTTLNVYYENKSVVDLFDEDKKIGNEFIKKTNSTLINLRLRTNSYSFIKLVNQKSGNEQTTYADSLGNFYFIVKTENIKEDYLITIKTPAGNYREINFLLIKDNVSPEIKFNNDFPLLTNKKDLQISGKVIDCKTLLINNNSVFIDSTGNFSQTISLNEKNILSYSRCSCSFGHYNCVSFSFLK